MSAPLFGTCRLIDTSEASIEKAASVIRAGGLVAFPTETVYGLGANALDADAVRDIFKAKGRPLTDPLIVHVISPERALELVEISGDDRSVFKALGDAFWPGPLTIISKAASCIPGAVTAETGFVGLRVPKHPLAVALIAASNRPIAAPSANRFGHVSPTKALHVQADFLEHGADGKEVLILDAEQEDEIEPNSVSIEKIASCTVGIESTVLKIVSDARRVIP
jgi:tRNA threonylcarbamoyl adenosine modification protein (Sua5/YciO/YrdC/YwlC family)